MPVPFSGIFRISGYDAISTTRQYAHALENTAQNRLDKSAQNYPKAPVFFPWKEEGESWIAVLLTGKEAQDFRELEHAIKYTTPAPLNFNILNNVKNSYAKSTNALDIYI